MFRLCRMMDTVHIAPADFPKPGDDEGAVILNIITEAINEKYPNKVVPEVGLCVALYDILEIGEAHLYQGSAAQHTAVEFRLVIFRPFVGQILTGKVASCDMQGVRMTMGFFDDVYVPTSALQKPSRWSSEENLWVWELYPDNPLYLDLENEARFRVLEVSFHPDGDGAPPGRLPEPGHSSKPVMCVTATIDEAGLGLVDWWPDDMPAEGEEFGEEGADYAEEYAEECVEEYAEYAEEYAGEGAEGGEEYGDGEYEQVG
uniref:DNA-directed RNA polymerase III subunit RPC8 n=1 Tax=Chrysotila carterae TaxID=13221 RepID=A0A7S4BAP9_CHRCT